MANTQAPTPGELTYIDIEDFTPGIRHRVMQTAGSGSMQPLGAADPTNTYRCIALPSGGIAPLPKHMYNYDPPGIEADITKVRNSKYNVLGFHVTGPVYLNHPVNGLDEVEFHFGFGYYFDAPTNTPFRSMRFRWEDHHIYADPVTITVLKSENTFKSNPLYNRHLRTSFVDCRMHPTDPAQVGYPLVAMAGDGTSAIVYWEVFPDPTAPTVDASGDIGPGNLNISRMVQHQGRLVVFQRLSWAHGSVEWHSDEQVWWTEVNLPSILMTNPAMFGQGQMAGYGAVLSVSAQQLFLVKNHGGAIVVSGDLDSPTVTAFPGVISTNGADIIPTYSSIGFIYAVKNGGIYAWQGGDNSLKISPYMEDNFWRITDDAEVDHVDGTFATWGDWILVTGNYLYDTTTDSWWLLEDPTSVQIFHWGIPPASQWAFGTPQFYTDGDTPLVWGWDKTVPNSSYRWKSQVLVPTIDKVVSVREITLLASGPVDSSVKITITSEDGDQDATQVEVFTILTQDLPRLYRKTTLITGTALQIQIDADSGDTDPAPIVYRVSLGVSEGQRLRNG